MLFADTLSNDSAMSSMTWTAALIDQASVRRRRVSAETSNVKFPPARQSAMRLSSLNEQFKQAILANLAQGDG
jgi:hypothetical protein